MYPATDTSVITSIVDADKLSRVDINTNEVIWNSREIKELESVCCFGGKYVIAYSARDKTMGALDVGTGKVRSTFTHKSLCNFGELCEPPFAEQFLFAIFDDMNAVPGHHTDSFDVEEIKEVCFIVLRLM